MSDFLKAIAIHGGTAKASAMNATEHKLSYDIKKREGYGYITITDDATTEDGVHIPASQASVAGINDLKKLRELIDETIAAIETVKHLN